MGRNAPRIKQEHDPQGVVTTAENSFREFTYLVCHDVGAPLRAVVNFSRLLRERYRDTLDERGERYLAFIMDGAQKSQAMLHALSNYSHLLEEDLDLAPVNCAALLEECRNELKEKILSSDAQLEAGPLPTVTADEKQLKRLFLALLDNALTYRCPEKNSIIRILAEEMEDAWKLWVSDNGIGIEPGCEERVFQPFKRLHTEAEYPGLGMGLAVASRIAFLHHGAMGVARRGEGGASFWVILPKEKP